METKNELLKRLLDEGRITLDELITLAENTQTVIQYPVPVHVPNYPHYYPVIPTHTAIPYFYGTTTVSNRLTYN